jgi:hypothetical protein
MGDSCLDSSSANVGEHRGLDLKTPDREIRGFESARRVHFSRVVDPGVGG